MGRHGIAVLARVAMVIVLLASTASLAQGQADRDTREVSNYVLTEAALVKYTQAVHSLGSLVKSMPGACADGEDAKSLDELAARLDAVPQVRAAMKSAGISSREYLVFSLSLLQNGMAAWALDQPGGKLPPGTSMANVKFFRTHDAALKKLGEETKTADCDDD